MITLQQIRKFEKMELRAGEVRLIDDEVSGYCITTPIEVEPFDELVVSWNARTPGRSTIKIEAQVRIHGEWSDFYPIALWNQEYGGSSYNKEDELAQTAIDVIQIKEPNLADAYRIRAWVRRASFGEVPRILGLYGTTRNSKTFELKMSQGVRPVQLDVPPRSQMIQHQAYANLICSPTCCGMLLGYYGIHVPTDEIIWQVQDKTTGIFGAWPLNTAALCTYGLTAKVVFLDDLYEALQEVEKGRPVITGIRYQEGELANAAIPKTNGHIILIVGYEDGYVIVNDSAAKSTDQVRRMYRIDQFLLVCSGVFYLVEKDC